MFIEDFFLLSSLHFSVLFKFSIVDMKHFHLWKEVNKYVKAKIVFSLLILFYVLDYSEGMMTFSITVLLSSFQEMVHLCFPMGQFYLNFFLNYSVMFLKIKPNQTNSNTY